MSDRNQCFVCVLCFSLPHHISRVTSLKIMPNGTAEMCSFNGSKRHWFFICSAFSYCKGVTTFKLFTCQSLSRKSPTQFLWEFIHRKATFPGGSVVKNPPAVHETWIRSLSQEDPLRKGMATHSNILAWRISWTEEPGGLQSMGSQSVEHDWESNQVISTHS